MQPRIVVLTGESGCGKTSLCERIAAWARGHGISVAGVLTPPRICAERKIGIEIEDVHTLTRRRLAEMDVIGGPSTEQWHFDADGLEWGAEILSSATPCELLVIDELGPLELIRGEAWQIGLDVLKQGHYQRALVVVRPGLMARFQARMGYRNMLTCVVTRTNQDDLFEQLTAELDDQHDPD